MLKNIYAFVAIALTVLGTAFTVSAPVHAADCIDSVFGIPVWYRNLPRNNGGCGVTPVKDSNGAVDLRTTIVTIALNVVQAAMVLAAYVTIFFIIKGGFAYMTSTGSPDGMSSAKKTITNAIIGLLIALLSAAIVNAIAGVIK